MIFYLDCRLRLVFFLSIIGKNCVSIFKHWNKKNKNAKKNVSLTWKNLNEWANIEKSGKKESHLVSKQFAPNFIIYGRYLQTTAILTASTNAWKVFQMFCGWMFYIWTPPNISQNFVWPSVHVVYMWEIKINFMEN